jgi:CRISPR-associated protein Csm5
MNERAAPIRLTVKLTPLTAVHIGTGQELTPYTYTLVSEGRNGFSLGVFSPETLLADLADDERRKFFSLCDEENTVALREFFTKKVQEKPESLLYRLPASSSFVESYKQHIRSPENQLIVQEMYRNGGSGKPVIPGSSIKGSIRTAMLQAVADEKHPPEPNNPRFFESDVLGYKKNVKEDPFRALRMGDCDIKGSKSEAVSEASIYSNKGFTNLSFSAEMIIGQLLGGNAYGSATLTIDLPLKKSVIPEGKKPWSFPDTKNTILGGQRIVEGCHRFYSENFYDEYQRFYRTTKDPRLSESMEALREEIDRIDVNQHEFLLRIGRFSQVENVTLREPYRKPRGATYGKSRTLVEWNDMYFPLGWVKATVMTRKR